jgi:uncharacterized membrane protein
VADRDGDDEHAEFRPLENPVPASEVEAEALPPTINVEPIRRAVRQEIHQEIHLIRQELRQEFRAEFHIGPLPHERTLEGYERLVPGSAERIINAFLRQGEHREELESYTIRWDNYRSWGGLAAGVFVSVLVLFLSYELIRNGHSLEGSALAVINLATLAGVFVYGTRSRREERVDKTEIMAEVRGRRGRPPQELPEDASQ